MNAVVRVAQKSDEPFIYSSWSKNAWHSEAKRQEPQPDKKEWFQSKFAEIRAAIEAKKIRVICPAEEPTLIMGYAVYENGDPIRIYIKKDYRKEPIVTLFQKKEVPNV